MVQIWNLELLLNVDADVFPTDVPDQKLENDQWRSDELAIFIFKYSGGSNNEHIQISDGWACLFGSWPRPFENQTFKMAALSKVVLYI